MLIYSPDLHCLLCDQEHALDKQKLGKGQPLLKDYTSPALLFELVNYKSLRLPAHYTLNRVMFINNYIIC